jgi:hypothetical protein
VTYDAPGIYGHAIGSPRTREGAALVERHAEELAAAGLRVHLVGQHTHFIASGYPGAVIDHRRAEETI